MGRVSLAVSLDPPSSRGSSLRQETGMLYGLLGLIVVVAIVLFLVKVAIGGGLLVLVAVILLLYLLFG